MSTSAPDSESTGQTRRYLPRNIEGLTPEIVRKAEIELNETPRRRQEALRELKLLIEEEDDFHPFMDDQFLLRFLRARKFDTAAAMKNLKNYYTYKARYSGILRDIPPSQLKHIFEENLQINSKYRDQEGRLVWLARFGNLDLDKTPLNDILAAIFLNTDFCLLSEATQICGMIYAVDLKGLSLHVVRHLASPSLTYRSFKAIQDCLPMRLKAFHVINEPTYFSIAYNIMRLFLSKKMKSRFQCHGKNLENFHKQVPQEILPQEFGGHLGPMHETKKFGDDLLGAEDYFQKLSSYGYGEKTKKNIKRRGSWDGSLFH